jgi:acetyl esterase/lipase
VTDHTDRVLPELRPGLQVYADLGLPRTLEEIPAARVRFAESVAVALALANPQSESSAGLVSRSDHLARAVSPDRSVRVRVHRPSRESGVLPVVLWIPGGGMVFSEFESDSAGCDELARDLGCAVVSVAYRLAPETPGPGGLEDCYAALSWVVAAAAEQSFDASRVAVLGFSAGGGIAAGLTLLTRDLGGPAVRFQCLVSPMLDDRQDTASAREFADIVSWSGQNNAVGWTSLLAGAPNDGARTPYLAPARAADLSGLPPAYVQVAELEIFRDEDLRYAERLAAAGIPCEVRVYSGAYHCFDQVVPEAQVSRQSRSDRLRALASALTIELPIGGPGNE